MMEKLISGIGVAVLASIGIFFAAVFGGTIVWLVWPVAIPAVFPGLVAAGSLAAKLSWWQSVVLTWLLGILIKSTNTTNNNK